MTQVAVSSGGGGGGGGGTWISGYTQISGKFALSIYTSMCNTEESSWEYQEELICVCVCVCVCVCMCVWGGWGDGGWVGWLHACVHVSERVYICVHVHACLSVCL